MRSLAALVLMACLPDLAGAAEFPVCINPDRSLRQVEEREPCKPGEQRVLLEQVKPEKPEIEETDPEVAALKREVTTLKKKLEALEERTMAMTLERRGSRIQAPMEVVAEDGSVLLRVASRVSSKTGDGARVTIGQGDNGGMALRIFSRQDKVLAGLGESHLGAGILGVGAATGVPTIVLDGSASDVGVADVNGQRVASISVGPTGAGHLVILGNGQPLGSISRGQNGGMLQLNNNDGAPMVEAGNDGTVGVVRAGPIIRASALPGLPGSFIRGRKQ